MSVRRAARVRRGFSFTEVLFAVVVLGIGFIMVAAVFPVAIQQTQVTSEETNGAAIARGAVNYFQTVATSALLPPTGTAAQPNRPRVFSVRDPQAAAGASLGNENLWGALRGNLILPDDDRYGHVLLYRRDGDNAQPGSGSPFAQVYVIPVQVRARSRYVRAAGAESDIYEEPAPTAPDMYNLQARPVAVTITDAAAGDRVTFTGTEVEAVSPGCYVVIADDQLTGVEAGFFNGRIYRVGNQVDGSTTEWELMPGNDFVPEDPDGAGPGAAIAGLTNARAFVVGRDKNTASGDYEGTAQDIGIYTTFIEVKP